MINQMTKVKYIKVNGNVCFIGYDNGNVEMMHRNLNYDGVLFEEVNI